MLEGESDSLHADVTIVSEEEGCGGGLDKDIDTLTGNVGGSPPARFRPFSSSDERDRVWSDFSTRSPPHSFLGTGVSIFWSDFTLEPV